MATLQQALTRIDAICPNAWDETAKLLWLNECESMIQTRILGVAPEQCITYDADTDRSTALLVPAPFDRLYVYYVIAMCDYAAHETAHYADSMMLFNAALDEYAKWYQRANGAAPIAPGQLQQIAANTKARHTHENLAVLDGITAEKTAAWDVKADRTAATASANGLMSKADKAKLDGIAAGATKVIVDSALSNASANPLQNKVIAAALDGKAGTAAATQSANGLMSKADKAKLDGIAAGATKVTVDSVVSASSVNPVQNKVIKKYVDSMAAGSGAVRYDATQTLAGSQKKQARDNIDAASDFVITGFYDMPDSRGPVTAVTLNKPFDAIRRAIIDDGKTPVLKAGVPPEIHDRFSLAYVDEKVIRFSAAAADDNKTQISAISIFADGSVNFIQKSLLAFDSSNALGQVEMSAAPTKDMEIATKKYVDDHATGGGSSGAVRYDEAQTLTEQQKLQARENAGALASEAPTITRGWMSICPDGSTDSNDAVHVTVTKAGDDNYTAALDGGPENWPVHVGGVATPTDAQTNYAANVAYVKAKIAAIGAGAALPSVTAADNGKILRVVGGAWAAASLPVYNGGVS